MTRTPKQLLHHFDAGSEYQSEQNQHLLTDHGIPCSIASTRETKDKANEFAYFELPFGGTQRPGS